MARSNVSLLSSLTILLLAITQVASAASMLEGYEKHTTWFWQRALVAKGWLYIDGGEIHGSSSADGDVKAAWSSLISKCQCFSIDANSY